VRELAEKERQCTTMELELRAALDKLEVYRRADDAAASAPPPAAAPTTATSEAARLSQQPDEDKSVEELRIELEQLRQAMALQGEQTLKVLLSCQFLACTQTYLEHHVMRVGITCVCCTACNNAKHSSSFGL